MSTTPDSEGITIVAQVVGFKTLKAEGGARVELDLFESKEKDILNMVLLANKRATVTVRITPYDKDEGEKPREFRTGSDT